MHTASDYLSAWRVDAYARICRLQLELQIADVRRSSPVQSVGALMLGVGGYVMFQHPTPNIQQYRRARESSLGLFMASMFRWREVGR